MGIAALVLWIVLLLSGRGAARSSGVWRAFFVMGFLNNGSPTHVWGQVHIASGLASILNATTPMYTIVIAGLFLAEERMTGKKILGVIIGLLGVTVLMGPSVLQELGTETLAQLAILGAAVFYGFSTTYGRRFQAMGLSPLQASAGQLSAATLMLIPLMLVFEQPAQLPNPGIEVWLAVICLGLFSTALAFILFLISSPPPVPLMSAWSPCWFRSPPYCWAG